MSFKEWKKYKLGDLLTTLTDYHANGSYKVLKENVELLEKKEYSIMIRTKNFEQNNFNDFIYVSKHSYDFLKKSKVLPRDIIMNKIANAGSIYLMPDLQYPVSLGMNLFLLRVNENIAFPEFIYYYLKANEAYVKSFAIGSVTTTITKEVVRNLDILLPTKDEQYKIISILKSIEDKIELNRQTNQTLEAIAQTLFKEMCMPKGDELPEGWRVGKLKDIIEINPKLSLKKNTIAKYVEMKDLSDDSAIIKSYLERDFSSGSKFQNGDVLLARITPCLENGKTGLVDFLIDSEIGWGSTEFIVLRGKIKVASSFVYCLSRLQSFRDFAIQSMVGSSGRQRVVDSILAEFEMRIPPKNILTDFDNRVEPLFKNIFSNNQESQTLITLRDSLLPKLMKGEITV
jgi:type I restriction enzyme S subunit